MKILLTQSGLLITIDSELLRSSFVQEFINNYTCNKLIFARSMLFFHNDTFDGLKRDFLKTLGAVYAQRYNFSKNFFVNALLKLKTRTIRLELDLTCKMQTVDVDLFTYEKNLLEIRVSHQDRWINEYFASLFKPYLCQKQATSFLVRIDEQKAKRRVQKMIRKKDLFDCGIIYNYDDDFVRGLFEDSALTRVDEVESETMKKMLECYAILDCPVGVCKTVLKQNYKKLAKAYHPDRVLYTQTKRVTHYTQKFQMLQEAYSTLKNFG